MTKKDYIEIVLLFGIVCIVFGFVSKAAATWVNGTAIGSYKITIAYNPIYAVLSLSAIDLLVRYAAFRDLINIQSWSLDIVTFSLVYRIGYLLVTPFHFKNWIIFSILAFAFLLGIAVYQWMFVQWYRKRFGDQLSRILGNSLSDQNLDEIERDQVKEFFKAYKSPDLWGILRRNEVENINTVLTHFFKGSSNLLHEDIKLSIGQRIAVVLALAFISSVSIWTNGIVLK